jgi:hypothetical protein
MHCAHRFRHRKSEWLALRVGYWRGDLENLPYRLNDGRLPALATLSSMQSSVVSLIEAPLPRIRWRHQYHWSSDLNMYIQNCTK